MKSSIERIARLDPIYEEPKHEQTTMRSNIWRVVKPDPIYKEPKHEQTTMRSKPPSAPSQTTMRSTIFSRIVRLDQYIKNLRTSKPR